MQNDYARKSDTLENLFQQTLNELCTYSPILAFDINKNHSLKNILSKIDDYLKLVINEFQINSSDDISKINKIISDQFIDSIMDDTLNTLERDVKKLAYKCSIYNYYKTRRILKKNKSLKLDEELLDSFLKNLFSQIS